MSTIILIQALSEAFDRAVNEAVDARMTAVMQKVANVNGQHSTDIDNLKQRIAALELRIPVEGMSEARVIRLIEDKVKEALDDHTNTYDHDEYDRIVGEVDDFDLDDVVTTRSLRDEVNDVLNSASFSVEVSL